jgi:hypothetical protein
VDRFGAGRGCGRECGKKKLIEAAIWWARLPSDTGVTDTLAEDMAAFGVKDFELPDWMREEESPSEFGVLEENWDAVNVFLACSTQWATVRTASSQDKGVVSVDRPSGIRYEALEIVIAHSRVAKPRDVFWRVQVMERAALREFATMRQRG